MSDPTSEPSCEPVCEPTNGQMIDDQTTNQRLEWDAELPTFLSPKRGKYGLSQKQDAKLPRKITISITQLNSNVKPFEAVNGISTSYTFEAVNGVNTKRFEVVNGVTNAHDKYIATKQVTFSDERDESIVRVLLSVILDQMILMVYNALLKEQCRVDEKFSFIPELVSTKSNEVRNMHVWFSSRPSAPPVRH